MSCECDNTACLCQDDVNPDVVMLCDLEGNGCASTTEHFWDVDAGKIVSFDEVRDQMQAEQDAVNAVTGLSPAATVNTSVATCGLNSGATVNTNAATCGSNQTQQSNMVATSFNSGGEVGGCPKSITITWG